MTIENVLARLRLTIITIDKGRVLLGIKRGGVSLDVVTYAFFSYILTAVISLLTIGLVLLVNVFINYSVGKEMQKHG